MYELMQMAFKVEDGFVYNRHWHKNYKLHRKNDLPAVERQKTGTKEYWIDGHEYFLQENGTREFLIIGYNFGVTVLHRTNDLPAVEYPNGDKEWWLWGKRHRLEGPAVIYGDKQFWFFNGELIKC